MKVLIKLREVNAINRDYIYHKALSSVVIYIYFRVLLHCVFFSLSILIHQGLNHYPRLSFLLLDAKPVKQANNGNHVLSRHKHLRHCTFADAKNCDNVNLRAFDVSIQYFTYKLHATYT